MTSRSSLAARRSWEHSLYISGVLRVGDPVLYVKYFHFCTKYELICSFNTFCTCIHSYYVQKMYKTVYEFYFSANHYIFWGWSKESIHPLLSFIFNIRQYCFELRHILTGKLFSFQPIGITYEQGMHYIAHLIHSVEYAQSSLTRGLYL